MPIIINTSKRKDTMNDNLRKFKHLFYCLKFQNKMKNWLSKAKRNIRIRIRIYHPSIIQELINSKIDIQNMDRRSLNLYIVYHPSNIQYLLEEEGIDMEDIESYLDPYL